MCTKLSVNAIFDDNIFDQDIFDTLVQLEVILRPNATTSNPFPCYRYPEEDGQLHLAVDEETSDEDSSYVSSRSPFCPEFPEECNTNIATYRLGLPNPNIPVGSVINFVTHYFRVRREAVNQGNIRMGIYTNSAYSFENWASPPVTYQTYSKQYITNPITGVAWTLDEINALEVACQLYGAYYLGLYFWTRCTQHWVVVNYTTPVGKVVSQALRFGRVSTLRRGWIEHVSGVTANMRRPHTPFATERPVQPVETSVPPNKKEECCRIERRLRGMYEIKIFRAGDKILHYRRKRDLIVWRGQSIMANLLSQGAVGTATASWRLIASSNSTVPDMGDDSGNPEATEFSPQIGTLVTPTYEFEPSTKPSGAYQTFGELIISGTINVTASATLRKIGIIDTIAVPNRHIIVEDAVVPVDVVNGDTIEIKYYLQLY